MRATQARIYLSHLEHNVSEIQKIAPTAKICLAVKANGYGHGAVPIAKKALEAGISFLSVAAVCEGADLREAGIDAPVLLLSATHKDEIPDMITQRLTPLVGDTEFVDLLDVAASLDNQLGRKQPVHLKIDTGMGRHGCRPEKAAEIALYISLKKNVYIEGVCTHLAVSDSLDADDIAFTKKQIALFNGSVRSIQNAGVDTGIVHCVASGGILMYPEAHFDMVRPGIIAYGYYPSVELFEHFTGGGNGKKANFKPIMELITSVTAIKAVHSGECISYGRKWVAAENTTIATLPIGYADGLVRKLSPGLSVTIRNIRYPIVGRICMDQCMVDIGYADSTSIERWDEVIIFGPQQNCNTAADLATILDTIPYEVLCLVSERVFKTYV